MIDINKIRENPEKIKQALLKKIDAVDFTELLEWDSKLRNIIVKVEQLQAKRNKVSAEVPLLKKQGQDVGSLLEEMKEVNIEIRNLESARQELSDKIQQFLEVLPNPPAEDVVAGGKENNEIIREGGKKPQFSFKPKDHIELEKQLNLVDYERGAKLGGNGFWIYTGLGARLEWAFLNYFIDAHLKDGYEFILPPHLLVYSSGYTAGQFPKFIDDVYHLERENNEGREKGLFLLPTAETALINYYRDEILKESQLPKKLFGYSPCYRKEAGSYRSAERGTIRGHQFNKVEMFIYSVPEESEKAHQELVKKAENLVADLGLHYRITKLAAKDCTSAMAKTYDIEIWIPSLNEYKEISSASNAHDYQARRGNMRYKCSKTGKNLFLHTLNASGLATSRLLPALLEQNQQPDGSVIIPEKLRPWIGIDRLK